MYVIAGYGGWPAQHASYDGVRARNDVWWTIDGANWTQAVADGNFAKNKLFANFLKFS